MGSRFWVETLGCPKNQVDSDKLVGVLEADGYAAADDPALAPLGRHAAPTRCGDVVFKGLPRSSAWRVEVEADPAFEEAAPAAIAFPTADELAERLTTAGIKVEAIHRRGAPDADGNLERFRVGKVLEAGRHPNADRLSLCRVDVGGRRRWGVGVRRCERVLERHGRHGVGRVGRGVVEAHPVGKHFDRDGRVDG